MCQRVRACHETDVCTHSVDHDGVYDVRTHCVDCTTVGLIVRRLVCYVLPTAACQYARIHHLSSPVSRLLALPRLVSARAAVSQCGVASRGRPTLWHPTPTLGSAWLSQLTGPSRRISAGSRRQQSVLGFRRRPSPPSPPTCDSRYDCIAAVLPPVIVAVACSQSRLASGLTNGQHLGLRILGICTISSRRERRRAIA